MRIFLLIFLMTTVAQAQEKQELVNSEILRLSMVTIRVRESLEKNWKKCIGSEAPDLDNFLEIPTSIMLANTSKQLNNSNIPEVTCEDALESSYRFSSEALCLLDENLAKQLYDLTEDPYSLAFFTFLERRTVEIKSGDIQKGNKGLHEENAKDFMEFFRKFNQKKIATMPKK